MSRTVRATLRVENLEARDVPAITGLVFSDADRDGIQDAAETGIAGVTVQLVLRGTAVDEVTTAADGTYLFPTVEPDSVYQVRIDTLQPVLNGLSLSPANQGSDDSIDSDAVPSGSDAVVNFSTVTTELAFDVGFGGASQTQTLTLGGTVFPDPDDIGTFVSGGVAGVIVELLPAASDTALAQTTTSAAGAYAFAGLEPGLYRVRLAASNFATGGPLAGFTPSSDSAPNPNDDVDDDSNGELSGTLGSGGSVVTGPITLAVGDEPTDDGDTDANTNRTVDFGVVAGDPPVTGGSLSGRVFLDFNDSGTFDGPDVGIQGATVTLSGGGLAAPVPVLTDANGNYTFPGLAAGTYTLTQTQPTTPPNQTGTDTAGTAGGTTTIANVIDAIVLDADEAATGYLFAETPLLSTGGTVFVDANGNGQFDTGEAGIPGVTLTLTGTSLTGGAIAPVTATTSATGVYTFTGLTPGTYAIAEAQPTGFTDGAEQNGTPAGTVGADAFTGIDLSSTAAASGGFNFGETSTTPAGTAKINGVVFKDDDGDGDQDAAETGIGGVTIRLTGTDGQGAVDRTLTTMSDGTFSFAGLGAGTYTIAETQPTGFTDGEETAGTAGGTTTSNDQIAGIVLTADQAGAGYLFAETPTATGGTASIGGSVFRDTDGDGDRDAAETGIANVTVQLTGTDDQGTVDRTTTTGTDGTFSFTDLRPGTYALAETQPTGFADGAESAGSAGGTTTTNDQIGGIVLTEGLAATDYLFAETEVPTTGTASVAGSVFRDTDGDGVRDVAETGIANVSIRLTGTDDQGAVDRTTTTGTDGTFSFTGLRPGTYALAETQPTGFTDGAETAGTAGGTTTTNDQIAGIILTQGLAATGYLFAESVTPATGTGSIAGAVYADANGNGTRQGTETGIANVSIRLTGTDDQGAVDRTTTTGTDGTFSFTGLRPGTYALAETQPATGFTDGAEVAGTAGGVTTTNDSITGITLTTGQAATGYLFAEVPTAADTPADLRVGVIPDDSSVRAGGTVVLTYTVRNRGGETATGVEALVRLGGLQFVSASSDDYDPATRTWAVGDVEGDGTATLEVTVRVPAGRFTPSARVTSDDTAAAPRTNSTTVSGTTARAASRFWFLSSGYTSPRVTPTPAEPPVPTPPPTTPTLVLLAASDSGTLGDSITTFSTVSLSGTTSPNVTVKLIETGASATADAAGAFTFAGVPLAAGANTLTVRARNGGGTTNFAATVTRAAAPTVRAAPAGVSVAAGAGTTVDLAGTFDDADITNSKVRFNTSAGPVNVELFDRAAPKTVANFLNYVADGDYANSIFHRQADLQTGTPFVLQGGGFAFTPSPTPALTTVPADPAVQNEPDAATRSNLKGTLAMAKLGNNPNSATNQFFFNLSDNAGILDAQNGGFTVFGKLVGAADQTVVDALAAIPTQNQSAAPALPPSQQGVFGEIPLSNYTGTAFPTDTTAANYALVNGVSVVSRTETLTYSVVSNSAPAVATATVSRNHLTIQGLAAGTTAVVVRATDQSGATVETTVNVTVA